MSRITRRNLLASLGIGGAGVATGLLGRDGPQYTKFTYAQSPAGDDRVTVAWYETYNGSVLEHQGGTPQSTANETLDPSQDPAYVSEVSGPVVSLGNVLPGDRGRLAIGLSLADRPEGAGPISLDLSGRLQANEENDLVEPEREAGDSSASIGELADAIRATVWNDSGLVPCDGRQLGDPVIATGSLRGVLATLAGTYRLCEGCFENGTSRCVGLSWSLPAATGDVVQSDSVTFEVAVEAHDRGDGG